MTQRFYVGQEVICVDASPGEVSGRCYLTEGAVYVIRGFSGRAMGGVLLHGIVIDAPLYTNGEERAFRRGRFRPAVKRKTSIAIFTAMLNTSKQREDA